MRLRLCTWNVNSVRLRHEQVARFVADQAPDDATAAQADYKLVLDGLGACGRTAGPAS